jgi:hypothetical protein
MRSASKTDIFKDCLPFMLENFRLIKLRKAKLTIRAIPGVTVSQQINCMVLETVG